eukprot:CAMPEP_0172308344 /NCGR_PEP_ID=MMETSP1058-20130122/8963_1 /TAXON_ID=83371 /ORGANISM="Detonula confervacea, Strain CCMP 353" /LENGTH=639 /DNA_ID=CAMNT_0013020731 /DNA_START=11 /DNA_END=1930 /DNA_ORIENTATION=+
MSSKRPGTVDYSKWDNLECSDSESEEDEDNGGYVRPPDDEEDDDSYYNSEEESDYESKESESNDDSDDDDDGSDDCEDYAQPRNNAGATVRAPTPTLAALQRAWNTDTTNITRPCANCFSPNASYRCSRCQLVRYCNVTCQTSGYPIHKLECVDAGKHASFWGVFDKKKNEKKDEDTNLAVLKARRNSKRRRALQRAAAAAAIERARRARMARGGAGAKGGGKGKGVEEREEECSICSCDFTVQGDGGVAFCCPTSHYMCNECCGIWVNSVMEDMGTSYPPKCPLCKAGISKDLFERQLSSTQQNTFRAHAARTALKPGEELIECKECGLFEVITDDPVLWWCPHCACGACRVCNKDLPQGVSKYDIEKSPHHVCATLRKPKALIEHAIEEGSKMRCPSCKLAGRKDDACTHMTCTKCSTEWCYVCGMSVHSCDKALPREEGRVNDIYLHNRDWEINEKRCPMYLTMILEVDLNWLGQNWEENATDEDFQDDERCLDYLHRFRTIKLLQDVREKIGNRAFISTFVAFDSIKNCGYTYNEIISTCTDKLIDRDEFLQNHKDIEERQGEDEEEAFADTLERQQIELALGVTPPDDEVDPDQLEEQLVSQAMQRSAESAAEDYQIREVMARSAEYALQEDHA